MNKVYFLRVCTFIIVVSGSAAFTPMAKLPWSFTPSVCLPMTDPSYDPLGQLALDDVSEEIRDGMFGSQYLYCKRGCCGDNRNPVCCEPQDNVKESTFETYKLVIVIAAGVAGVCIITAIVLCLLKMYLKKRRLIRDIEAINRMNNMKDLAKENKQSKYHKDTSGATDNRPKKMFKSSKKAPVLTVQSASDKPAKMNQPAVSKLSAPMTTTLLDNVDGTGFNDNTPSYATVDLPQDIYPPTRAVGDLPVFLPTKSVQALAPLGSQAPAKVTKPLIFSTPLAKDPVVFSGPIAQPPPPAAYYSTLPPLAGTTLTSFSESKPPETRTSPSSSSPVVPWDDDELLLYFSDPRK